MNIAYLGHACFCLTSKKGTKIIIDPYEKVGYELPKGLQADIVLCSHGHFDHHAVRVLKRADVIKDDVQECVYDDVKIHGIESWHDDKQGTLRGKNIMYVVEMDGVKICHMGDIGEAYHEDLAKKIGCVDILLIPVGGTYTINAKQAKEYVDKLTPNVAIPMHFKSKECSLDICTVDAFLSYFNDVQYAENAFEYIRKDERNQETTILYMGRK